METQKWLIYLNYSLFKSLSKDSKMCTYLSIYATLNELNR